MPDVDVTLATKVVTGRSGKKELMRDDVGALRQLIAAVPWDQQQYRSMRRSVGDLDDRLMEVELSQGGEDSTTVVRMSAEQVRFLYDLSKEVPKVNGQPLIFLSGTRFRKLLDLLEDTKDEMEKGREGKAEAKAEQGEAARPVEAEA